MSDTGGGSGPGVLGSLASTVGSIFRGRADIRRERSAVRKEQQRFAAEVQRFYGPGESQVQPDVVVGSAIRSALASPTFIPRSPSAAATSSTRPNVPPSQPRPAPTPGSAPGASSSTARRALGYVQLATQVLNLLRMLGVRLPLDPKPPRFAFPTFNLLVPGGAPNMPYNLLPGSFQGERDYNGGGFLGGLGSLAGGVAGIINAIRQPAMPGMGFVGPILGSTAGRVLGGAAAGAAGAAGLDWLLGSGGGSCPTAPFAAGSGAARAQTFVAANPVTGKAVWFKPAGRPLLWSGDLSAARRVRKIAGRARRRVGGR